MASAKIQVKGMKQLFDNMKELDKSMRKRIATAMTGRAANVIKKAAIRNAPESEDTHEIEGIAIEPGNLKRNVLVAKRRKSKLTSEHVTSVRGKEKGKYASRYASMVEYGTVKMPAKPFMRPAFDSNLAQALNTMKETGEKRLAEAVKKLRK